MKSDFIGRVLSIVLAFMMSILISYVVVPILLRELPHIVLLVTAILIFLINTTVIVLMFIRKGRAT